MIRNILAVLLAPLIWGAVMVPGNQLVYLAFPEALQGDPSLPYLVTALCASFIYSVVSGAVAAIAARREFNQIGLFAGIAVFAVGLLVQISFWEALPVWYHLVFLASLIPVTMTGAAIWNRQRGLRFAQVRSTSMDKPT